MPKQAIRPHPSRLTRSATPVSFICIWPSRSMSVDIVSSDVSPWVLLQCRGPPLPPLSAAQSWQPTCPMGLSRWLSWPTLTINRKNVFAFNGMHHMFIFMYQFRVILDMHPLTKFKQCLRLHYNLQLIKPQNKWLELFHIFINFLRFITLSIKTFIKNLPL